MNGARRMRELRSAIYRRGNALSYDLNDLVAYNRRGVQGKRRKYDAAKHAQARYIERMASFNRILRQGSPGRAQDFSAI